MEIKQRKVVVVTSLGKKYSGLIDIPNESLRTTDLFNSANVFWRNPNEKCYDNAVMLYDVKLLVDDLAVYKTYEKIQVKLSEIFYFYDDLENVCNETERQRANVMIKQTQENAQQVNIITKRVAHSFYDIQGTFFGLFKKKSKDKFFPLTDTSMFEIYKKQDKWGKKQVCLPHNFIGVSNQHIESVVMG